jgi:hypothetical protein
VGNCADVPTWRHGSPPFTLIPQREHDPRPPDERRWISCRGGFFLPARVLGAIFRGKYLALLEQSFRRGRLGFHGQLQGVADPAAFDRLLRQARRKKWVVYVKPPFGVEPTLKYLARYTHRIALSNDRLLKIDETAVTFT